MLNLMVYDYFGNDYDFLMPGLKLLKNTKIKNLLRFFYFLKGRKKKSPIYHTILCCGNSVFF